MARGALGVPEPAATAPLVEPDLLFVPLAASIGAAIASATAAAITTGR